MVVIRKNGMALNGPDKPRRDDYIRATVTVTEINGRSINDLWNTAVRLAQEVYQVTPTEDNTVGQIVQEERAKTSNPIVFSLGMNLYGMSIRKLHKHIQSVKLVNGPIFGNYHQE